MLHRVSLDAAKPPRLFIYQSFQDVALYDAQERSGSYLETHGHGDIVFERLHKDVFAIAVSAQNRILRLKCI